VSAIPASARAADRYDAFRVTKAISRQPRKARDLSQQNLDGKCHIMGKDHPSTLMSAHNLAADLPLDADDRPSRASQPQSRTKMR
jgi:hypothetical protein